MMDISNLVLLASTEMGDNKRLAIIFIISCVLFISHLFSHLSGIQENHKSEVIMLPFILIMVATIGTALTALVKLITNTLSL